MMKWLLIAAGGALGSVLRYVLHAGIQRTPGLDFPLGTFAVNMIGCLLIGFLATLFMGPLPIREEYRLGIIVGILGGFTTFSAFGWETFERLQAGQIAIAALYVAFSCGFGLIAVWFGNLAAKQFFGA
jgi:fluoride exporter